MKEFEYDEQADTLYLRVLPDDISETVEVLKDWPMLLIDFNKSGLVVGVEVVGVKEFGYIP